MNNSITLSNTRRTNLRYHLVNLGRGAVKELATKINRNTCYISQIISLNSKRAFPNQLATNIERALGIKEGSLDAPTSRNFSSASNNNDILIALQSIQNRLANAEGALVQLGLKYCANGCGWGKESYMLRDVAYCKSCFEVAFDEAFWENNYKPTWKEVKSRQALYPVQSLAVLLWGEVAKRFPDVAKELQRRTR